MPTSAFTLKIRTGLGNGAVAAALRVQMAIAGVSGAGRLELCPGGICGRGGGSAILGYLLCLSQRHEGRVMMLAI